MDRRRRVIFCDSRNQLIDITPLSDKPAGVVRLPEDLAPKCDSEDFHNSSETPFNGLVPSILDFESDHQMKLEDSPQQKINTCNWSPEQMDIYNNASKLRAESGDQETQLWSHLFTPKGKDDFVDNAHIYNEICSWLEAWKNRLMRTPKPERKNNTKRKRKTATAEDFEINDAKHENPLVITGPTGAGKTSSVYCAAAKFNARIIEISAAERRNAASLEQRLAGALSTHLVSKDQDIRNMFTPKKPSAKPNSNFGPQDIRSMFSPKTPTIKRELNGGTHDSPVLLEDEESKERNVQNLFSPSSALSKVSLNPIAHDFSVILVDDCDITYATDSNFWPTLKTMCIESRVPIVFTCTNFLHVNKMLKSDPVPVYKCLHLCLPDSLRLATRLQAWIAGYTQQNHSIRWLKKIIEGCNCDVRATLNALHFQISSGLIEKNDEPAVEQMRLSTYLQRVSALSQLDASFGKSASTHWTVREQMDLDFVPKEFDDSITRSSEIGSAFYEFPSLTSALEPSYRAKQFSSLNPFSKPSAHSKQVNEAVRDACLRGRPNTWFTPTETTLDYLPCLVALDQRFRQMHLMKEKRLTNHRKLHPFDVVHWQTNLSIDNKKKLKDSILRYTFSSVYSPTYTVTV
ncbi:ATPase family AAA domain-containing protein 5 [Ditylenchus destructor]|uniref:ATPase family AAA domain-containing protein 5 n=1 Tax=Ditylenchus destructor TaxID=166010 RepID=A0AAD4NM94_9BILA|nr:ATPase family AAA domain-containing protein 5 [Ditylenchus destructor]